MKPVYKTSPSILLSGGGTGGHIYPAIALADEIKRRFPSAHLHFVGAKDRMEMQKVPQAGYGITGLWISGLNRSQKLKNLSFPFKVLDSLRRARQILKKHRPDLVIGTGGYASGPLLFMASQSGIPCLLQEQNSFPGITNKLLKNKADAICVAYEGMEAFFPKEKLHYTGNPIRSQVFQQLQETQAAKQALGFAPDRPLILSVGGSQGSRTLNQVWAQNQSVLVSEGISLLWQTGALEYEKIKSVQKEKEGIQLTKFIYDMQLAYAAADLIVSRAGAMAISELSLVGKPTLLVPFPNSAEDHQKKNAQQLVEKKAAIMVEDNEADRIVPEAVALLKDTERKQQMAANLKQLGRPDATQDIVDIVEQILAKKHA